MQIGDKAPDFTLLSQFNHPITLSELLKKGPVVVYFYPKDETSVCTAQACSFRDHYEAFTQAGATVVGISSDSVSSHAQFAQHHRLPFLLLSDAQEEVRKKFAVPRTLGIMPGRVTYLIDQKGIVRYMFNSAMQAEAHVTETLAQLQKLAKTPKS